ncbi:hypothetical protein COU54_03570 [Candidatus Pacearchaeota archaeon CG10_big_fil_rev_8_21_14_0_10_31_24]|nr:MAG: hypothetical protein COU54_03570 [Candidatus Pacearchaeota archaeon CG10_big_fil_rev_8_21_14_0_10_31_24]
MLNKIVLAVLFIFAFSTLVIAESESQEVFCVEDNGNSNLYSVGEVRISEDNSILKDFCFDNEEIVAKYSCEDSLLKVSFYECDNGCSQGACLLESKKEEHSFGDIFVCRFKSWFSSTNYNSCLEK